MQKKNIAFNILKLLLYCLIGFIFNQSLQIIFPDWQIYPDFFYSLIWVFAYFNSGIWNLILGILVGFFHDWLFSPVMGIGIFIGMISSIISSNFLQTIWQRRTGFLFVQVVFLQLITKLCETVLIYISFALRYDLPISLQILQKNFFSDLPLRFILNLGATAIWILIVHYLIPFVRNDQNHEFTDFSESSQEVF